MKPEISPNFTLDDIDKIREYAGERYMSLPEEEFRVEIRASSSRMQEELKEIRAKRLAEAKEKQGKIA
ncbi:MAG: hypothetical protein LBR61_07045 [Synergistaceae bacterium]|jgi:hypothetical protein|nr:hypothetical protein [Synergistaceae bacterium]